MYPKSAALPLSKTPPALAIACVCVVSVSLRLNRLVGILCFCHEHLSAKYRLQNCRDTTVFFRWCHGRLDSLITGALALLSRLVLACQIPLTGTSDLAAG